MRVLQFIATSGPGGAESILFSLSQTLVKKGLDVTAASSGKQDHLFERLRHADIPSIRLESTETRSQIGELCRTIRKIEPDVIHAHMFDANLPAALSALLCRIPSVLTVHSTVYEIESWKRRMAYRTLARMGSRIAAVSDTVATALVGLGVPQARVSRVYNGVDLSVFQETNKIRAFRAELGVEEDCPLVGMIANVRPAKDHALLIQAAAGVIERVPKAHFVLVGDGAVPGSSELTREIENAGTRNVFHLSGLRNDIPSVLASLDLFVLASKIEGLPVSVIEAMASSVPVVASDVGGVGEVVRDGVTGYLVPPGDKDLLAERIIEVISDNELAGRFGSAGKRRVEMDFCTDSMAGGYCELYLECLGIKNRGKTNWKESSGSALG